ncbi:MAG: hypothetical protein NTV44_01190 [Firmicutes bacterium]|nr:hypothetical protein [Bacillota bacterium]
MKMKTFFSIAFAGLAFLLASCAVTTSSSSASLSSQISSSSEVSSVSSSVTSSGSLVSSSELRVFTLTELAQYNGDNGSLAYIAVDWVVYDVTNVANWTNGWHNGVHYAGTDCTAAFASSPHSASLLATLTIVGTLAH